MKWIRAAHYSLPHTLWKIRLSGYCPVEEMAMSLNFSPYPSPCDFSRERKLIPRLSRGGIGITRFQHPRLYSRPFSAQHLRKDGEDDSATLKAKTPGHPDLNNEMISRIHTAVIGQWADCAKKIV